jgi:NAD+ diphosphatase
VRQKGWPEKMFGLVTGFLEKGETPEEGILREVQEELDLRGNIVSLVGVYAYKEANQVILVYHVTSEGKINLSRELENYKAVPPEKLKPWPFGTGLAIREWLERRRS